MIWTNPPPAALPTGLVSATKTVATGTVGMGLTITSTAIVFSPAMPDSSAYTVLFEPNTGLASNFGVTNKTITSFMMWSVGVTAVIKFTVMQD